MGAAAFITEARGRNAQEAFHSAVERALYEHGHGGYTGTIAEKTGFVGITLPEGADPVSEAGRMIDEDDDRIADKWGPAGYFTLGDGRYLFFGWASS